MSEVDTLYEERQRLSQLIHLKDLVIKLEANPQFQQVILKEYLTNYSLNNLRDSTSSNVCINKNDSLLKAQASTYLLHFLNEVKEKGFNAEEALYRLELDN